MKYTPLNAAMLQAGVTQMDIARALKLDNRKVQDTIVGRRNIPAVLTFLRGLFGDRKAEALWASRKRAA